jgi:hypothetical protein
MHDALVGDGAVLGQIGRLLRDAVLGQISGRRADEAPDRSYLQRRHPGGREVGDTHRHVESFLHQVHDPVNEQGGGAHPGMAAEEVEQSRGDVHTSEQHRGGDRQLPMRLTVRARRRLLRLVDLGQDAAAILEVAVAGLGQAHAATAARKASHG